MATMLDILTSIILGGILLLNIVSAQSILAENSSTMNGDVLVQEMLISQVQQIEGEFRNMGTGMKAGNSAVVDGDTSSITFVLDIDRDASHNVDTVVYSIGPVSDLASTQNSMDRYVIRTVRYFDASGGSPQVIETYNAGIVTMFHLRYIAANGDVLTTPLSLSEAAQVAEVEISMEVQNPYALYRPQGMVYAGEREALYSTSYWQQTRLSSQNLRR
jgi:hypothetical protein